MNVFYLTFRLFFLIIAIINPVLPIVAQEIFTAKVFPKEKFLHWQEELADYQIISLDSRALLAYLQKNSLDAKVELVLDAAQHWKIELTEENIQAANYKVQIADAKGIRKIAGNGTKHYGGGVLSPEKGACRLTLAAGFIYGAFEVGETTWFIEPARHFGQGEGFDVYVLYKASDVLSNPNGHCAAVELETATNKADWQKSAGACYTVEIALAADYLMFQQFGSVEVLENYVLGILNLVNTNYDDEFEHTIRFEAVTLYVSTCDTCDPWQPLTNFQTLLANFRDWGNAGGFGVDYDVATFWTGRVLDNNIGGGGYYGVLCGNQRYNVLRRYSANANIMRALQAHELGHNLNARHDATGSPYIMAPVIENVSTWSPTSVNTINAYFRTVLDMPGCIATCENLAEPQAAFSANVTSGCAPLTVQFFNESLATANSWQWIFTGADTLTTLLENPHLTFIKPGAYRVQLVVSNPGGFDTLRLEDYITVLDQPVAAFTTTATPGSASVIFANNSANAISFTWFFGDGNSSNSTQPTHIYGSDGTYDVQLIARNACGADTVMQRVIIETAPTADFAAQNATGCAPLTVQFQNQSSANATSFEWQFPGGVPASSNERNPSVKYLQPGTYKVSLTIRNAIGNAMVTKNNFIIVKSKPTAAFAYSRAENEVTFTNQSDHAQSLVWNFGDGSNADNTQQITHAYAQPGTYAVHLIATNECGSDTSTQNIQLSGAVPQANFGSNHQEGCPSFSVQYNDLSSGDIVRRRWHFPGGAPELSDADNPLVTYNGAGTYPVSLRVENFWGADSLILENYITVLPLPTADFEHTVGGTEVTFKPDIVNPEWQYFWHFGDGQTSTDTMPTHTYDSGGNYMVELTVTNACGSTTTNRMVAIITTFVTNQAFQDKIALSPNPNSGQFQLSFKGRLQVGSRVRVVNMLGQEVKRQAIVFADGNPAQWLDCSDLPSGWYVLEIRSEAELATIPFLIQKR